MAVTMERICVACRKHAQKSNFLRIVLAADGRMAVNPGTQLEGRSAYICPSMSCYNLAVKNRSLQRSLRRPLDDKLLTELKETIMRLDNSAEVKL